MKKMKICPSNRQCQQVDKRSNLNLKQMIRFFLITGSLFLSMTTIASAQTKNQPDLMAKFKESNKELAREKADLKTLKDLSPKIITQFKKDFPDAKEVSWSNPQGYVEADFILHHKPRMAFYDYDNQLIGQASIVDYNHLPQKGRERISKEYSSYAPIRTMYYMDNENNSHDMFLLGLPVENKSYFTLMQNGTKEIILRTDKDGETTFFSTLKK